MQCAQLRMIWRVGSDTGPRRIHLPRTCARSMAEPPRNCTQLRTLPEKVCSTAIVTADCEYTDHKRLVYVRPPPNHRVC
jgi:hypothetical protein